MFNQSFFYNDNEKCVYYLSDNLLMQAPVSDQNNGYIMYEKATPINKESLKKYSRHSDFCSLIHILLSKGLVNGK